MSIEKNKNLPHPLMKKQWMAVIELIKVVEYGPQIELEKVQKKLQEINDDINTILKNKRDKPNVKCSVDGCKYHDGRYCKVAFAVNIDNYGYCISKKIPKEDK